MRRPSLGLLIALGASGALALGSAGAQESVAPGPRATLEGQGLELRRAILQLARAGGYGVVVGPDVSGTIDLDVKDEPWERALASVLRPRGLHAIAHGSVLAVSSRTPDPSESEVTERGFPAVASARSVWVRGPGPGVPPEASPEPAADLPPPKFPWDENGVWRKPSPRPVADPSDPHYFAENWRFSQDFTSRLLPEIDVETADLKEVCTQIAMTLGTRIVGAHECITLKLPRTPWRDGIAAVASHGHCRIRELPDLMVLERARRVSASLEDSAPRLLRGLAAQARASVVVAEDAPRLPLLVELEDDAWESVVAGIADAARMERRSGGRSRGRREPDSGPPLARARPVGRDARESAAPDSHGDRGRGALAGPRGDRRRDLGSRGPAVSPSRRRAACEGRGLGVARRDASRPRARSDRAARPVRARARGREDRDPRPAAARVVGLRARACPPRRGMDRLPGRKERARLSRRSRRPHRRARRRAVVRFGQGDRARRRSPRLRDRAQGSWVSRPSRRDASSSRLPRRAPSGERRAIGRRAAGSRSSKPTCATSSRRSRIARGERSR